MEIENYKLKMISLKPDFYKWKLKNEKSSIQKIVITVKVTTVVAAAQCNSFETEINW